MSQRIKFMTKTITLKHNATLINVLNENEIYSSVIYLDQICWLQEVPSLSRITNERIIPYLSLHIIESFLRRLSQNQRLC